MQDESIRQSLLLWIVYTKKLDKTGGNDEICKAALRKIQKYLTIAGITKVEILFEILNFCTVKYLQDGEPKAEQFSMEELEQAGCPDTDILIKNGGSLK